MTGADLQIKSLRERVDMSKKPVGAAAVIMDSDGRILSHPDGEEVTECKSFDIEDLPRPISDFTISRIKDALNTDSDHLFHTIGPRQWFE